MRAYMVRQKAKKGNGDQHRAVNERTLNLESGGVFYIQQLHVNYGNNLWELRVEAMYERNRRIHFDSSTMRIRSFCFSSSGIFNFITLLLLQVQPRRDAFSIHTPMFKGEQRDSR